MNNLWSVYAITLIGICGLIVGAIMEFCEKKNHYVLKTILFICLAIILFVIDFSCFQDLVEQNTTTVVAEYVKYTDGRTGATRLYFSSEDGQFDLNASVWTRTVADLEKGKTYEIEYFNNSKVIKEYKLIE